MLNAAAVQFPVVLSDRHRGDDERVAHMPGSDGVLGRQAKDQSTMWEHYACAGGTDAGIVEVPR